MPLEASPIECVRCGKSKGAAEFYVSKYSKVFNTNAKKVPVCKECLQSLMDEYTKKIDERSALIICCAILDIPFIPEAYASVSANNGVFGLGFYVRQAQLSQYRGKSFVTTIADGELAKTSEAIKETMESKWSKNEKQNRNYCISTVGYDPFENCGMTEEDRKYCFNLLAGYCDIDGIKEDAHKMTSCIQMVQSQLQVQKIDRMINQEFFSAENNDSKIKSLTESKKRLQDGISKLAQDNNISSNNNDNSKRGKNTLSEKMKEMTADGFEAARVNLFDIKTAEAFKQVEAISLQNIMEQLNFDNGDYGEMVKDQLEMITSLREEKEILEEENRNLKNEMSVLRTSKK